MHEKIYVHGVAAATSEEALRAHFGAHGDVVDVHLVSVGDDESDDDEAVERADRALRAATAGRVGAATAGRGPEQRGWVAMASHDDAAAARAACHRSTLGGVKIAAQSARGAHSRHERQHTPPPRHMHNESTETTPPRHS